jgi:hypothetical protein
LTEENTRRCVNCFSPTTLISKKTGCAYWYKYQDGYICNKCYCKLIIHPKWGKKWDKISYEKHGAERNKIFNPRHLKFKGRSLLLKENPRKGRCELCGLDIGDFYTNHYGEFVQVKITVMHHFAEYHDDDPLKDTIELCASCHRKIHVRMKKNED